MKANKNNFPALVILFLFTPLYLILSINSRPASDDFYYLWLANNFGGWGGMKYQYLQWSGRWSAHLIACTLIPFWKSGWLLPCIEISSLSLLILVIGNHLKNILKNESIALNNNSCLLSISIISSFFFATYDIGETWFWYIIIITYLWSIVAFLFLLTRIFYHSFSVLNCLLIIFPGAYVGGASESYSIVFMIILFYCLFVKINLKQNNISQKRNIIFALLIISCSFLISVMAPGTEIRHSLLPQTTIDYKIISSVKSFAKFFVRYLPHHLPMLILLSIPFFIAGNNSVKILNGLPVRKSIFRITLIYFALIFCVTLPTAMVMSEQGPERALSLISLASAIYFSFIAFHAGKFFPELLYRKIFQFSGTIIIAFTMIVILIKQLNITGDFSCAYDKRMEIIQRKINSGNNSALELAPLPAHGMLYWEEISNDTTFFVNQHLKKGLNLPFEVKLNK
jgi:hypothetical protein